ncbi:hypothetical protein BPY_06200 [Bifidobacterium psychraerophilum]
MSEEGSGHTDRARPDKIIMLSHYPTSGWCDPVTGSCISASGDEGPAEGQDTGDRQQTGM